MSGSTNTPAPATVDNNPALGTLQQAADLWKNVALPTINTTPYTTQNWLQDYTPTNYTPFTGSATTVAVDPADRAAETDVLGQLQGLAKGGFQPSDLEALNTAVNAGTGASNNALGQTLQNLAARGEAGGGTDAVARMMAGQTSANSANSAGVALAQAALNRQLAAITGAGQEASTIQAQDLATSADNANILNQFNTSLQNLKTQSAANAAANANAAQQYNLTGRQNTANTNTTIGNQNLDRANSLAQTGYSNALSKLSGQTNALTGFAQGQDQAQAAAAANAQAAAAGSRADVGLGISGLAALNNATATGTSPTTGASTGLIGSGLSSGIKALGGLFSSSSSPTLTSNLVGGAAGDAGMSGLSDVLNAGSAANDAGNAAGAVDTATTAANDGSDLANLLGFA